MSLCHYCATLDLRETIIQPVNFTNDKNEWRKRRRKISETVSHHGSLEELADCALLPDSCPLCKLFLLSWVRTDRSGLNLSEFDPRLYPWGHEISRVREAVRLRRQDDGMPQGSLYVGPYHNSLDKASEIAGICMWQRRDRLDVFDSWSMEIGVLEVFFERGDMPQEEDIVTDFIWKRDIQKDAGAQPCLELAAAWLRDCLEQHDLCTKVLGFRQRLPTRVISVGAKCENPRLLITKDTVDEYVALSYCWGPPTGKQLKLTRADLAAFQNEIKWSLLPKTLADAVCTTRTMGIRYLWIDALCIIQDDAGDWRTEAARMNEVYQNATVTLFATNSSTSDEGFLNQRALVPGCSLPFGSHGGRISLRIHHDWLINHTTDDNFGIRTHKAPWRTRGWTLQEYLSASRGLVFTAHQTSWNCPARVARENGQRIDKATDQWRGTENHFDARRNTGSDSFTQVADGWTALTRLREATPECGSGSVDEPTYRALLVAHFYRVTNDFVERSFTVQSDKLAATAGLAKLVEAKLSSSAGPSARYWAGLWDADWARGLAWRGDRADLHADFDRLLGGQAAGFASAAPSWSWASVADSYYDSWAGHEGLVAPPRGLVGNVRPPEVRDEDDRFIPRGPLVLRLAAPLRRLSDRWYETGCHGGGDVAMRGRPVDLAWMAFEKYLRKQLFVEQKNLRVPEDELRWRHRISEFGQKHRAWPGQQFAVIQLLEWESMYRSRDKADPGRSQATFFLLLETVDAVPERYRRVAGLSFSNRWMERRRPLVVDKERQVGEAELHDLVKRETWVETEIELE